MLSKYIVIGILNPLPGIRNPQCGLQNPRLSCSVFLFDWFNSTEFCSDWKLQRSGLERRTGLFQASLIEWPYLWGQLVQLQI